MPIYTNPSALILSLFDHKLPWYWAVLSLENIQAKQSNHSSAETDHIQYDKCRRKEGQHGV